MSDPIEPTGGLRMIAGWVRADPDESWNHNALGRVYRRGRWLATLCDEAGQPGVLAVSAYRTEALAQQEFTSLAQQAFMSMTTKAP